MKRLLVAIFGVTLICPAARAATCAALSRLALLHGTIDKAELVTNGTFPQEEKTPITGLPAFCRVIAVLKPTPDSNIRIEVWMPASGWNGDYEGTGNGGYGGSIVYSELAIGLQRNFATANTDMGTAPPPGQHELLDHPEKWQDWGSRSTHEMTVAAKEIIQAYYGRTPEHSYFLGCSTGGQQGLVEAQRFPDDYDGIVAGAPANNRTHLHMSFIWDLAATDASPESDIPASKLSLITNAVLNSCSAEKTVASDRFLANPAGCNWDPQALLCKSSDTSNCLTPPQVETARKLYDGPRNPVTQLSIYPGLPRGSESNWPFLLTPPGEIPRFDSLFHWTFGANWNWRTFDFDHDVATVNNKLASIVNATDPNLQTFKAHGHKLIVYHGWADVVVPSLESINYYRSVEDAQAKEAAIHHRSKLAETERFYRLFMVPGMGHCGDGPGLNVIHPLDSIELWVEKGIAPKSIVAHRVENHETEMSRPVCPYPQPAHYNGVGDTNDAASFSCAPSETNGNVAD